MIVGCYGITKFPENGNYAMVLMRFHEGNLREYLQKNHSKLTLKNRITILNHLCQTLYHIHEKDLIHCDLHSGNLLIQSNSCYITDLGLCGPVDDKSSKKIYGIVSYIAHELLRDKDNTKNTKLTYNYELYHQKVDVLRIFPTLTFQHYKHLFLSYSLCYFCL